MTRLRSIGLGNVRRFAANASIDFGAGATIVLAPNGSGKTAVFEAIEFGLTGTVARLGGDLSALVRDNEPRLEVTLDFGEITRRATLSRGGQPHHTGDLGAALGGANPRDLPFLLRMTHLLEQRDANWFVFAETEAAGNQLSRLPVGRDAARASSVLAGARNVAGRAHTSADAAVASARAALNDWQSLVALRDRVAAPPDGSLVPLAELRTRLEALTLARWAKPLRLDETSASITAVAAELQARLREHVQRLRAFGATVESLQTVVTSYADATAQASERRQGLAQVETLIADTRLAVERHAAALDRERAALAACERERIRIAEQRRFTDELASARAALAVTQEVLVSLSGRLPQAEANVLQRRATREQAQALGELHVTLRARADDLQRRGLRIAAAEAGLAEWTAATGALESLEGQIAEAQVALPVLLSSVDLAVAAEGGLRAGQRAARAALDDLTAASDAVRAAVAAIAEHLPAHRDSCPVCGEPHGGPELRRRISAALSFVDPAIIAATERSAAADSAVRDVDSRIARLHGDADRARARLSMLEGSRATIVSQIASLLAGPLLKAGTVGEASDEIAKRKDEFRRQRDDLARELAAAPAAPSSETLASLTSAESLAQGEATRLRQTFAEAAATGARVADRVAALDAALADVGGGIDLSERATEADNAFSRAVQAIEALQLELGRSRAHGDAIGAIAGELRQAIAGDEERRRAALAAWSSVPLAGEPATQALFDARRAVAEDYAQAEQEEQELASLQAMVARWNAAEARRSAQLAVDRARGTTPEPTRTAFLTAACESAISEERRRTQIKDGLASLEAELAAGLGDLHKEVITPFTPRWQALLRRVVRDPRFEAPRLSYYKQRLTQHADMKVPLHQGVVDIRHVASEAQSTDLQLTFLLSMALSHAWCPWRALLLDDPTQHHDLVHASAVFDVLRDYIAEHSFQVLMATHDALQARFFQRKLMNDGIEVRVWTLQPEEAGVRAIEIS